MDIFDQIMVSQTLIESDYSSIAIGKRVFITNPFSTNIRAIQGYPKRHSVSEVGFSDFPVYIYLIKEAK
jgi:hypothetical protein